MDFELLDFESIRKFGYIESEDKLIEEYTEAFMYQGQWSQSCGLEGRAVDVDEAHAAQRAALAARPAGPGSG